MVAEVASGLRVTECHRLKKFDVDCSSRKPCSDACATGVGHVGKITSSAPEVSKVRLRGVYRKDGNAKEALIAVLWGFLNLERVHTGNVKEERIAADLGEVYCRICLFLESLAVRGVDGLTGDVLVVLTGSNILDVLVHFSIRDMLYFTAVILPLQSTGKGLLEPLTLSALNIGFPRQASSKEEFEKDQEELWTCSEKSPILDVLVSLKSDDGNGEADGIDTGVSHQPSYIYARTIDLNKCDISFSACKSLGETFPSNTRVCTLLLVDYRRRSLKLGWAVLFGRFCHNPSMASLNGLLRNQDISIQSIEEVMDLLQVNLISQEIKFPRTGWDENWKEALVQEVLHRNKKLTRLLLYPRKSQVILCRGDSGSPLFWEHHLQGRPNSKS